MCKIMERHYSYVPKLGRIENMNLPSGESEEIRRLDTWTTLFGGDQLTVARARGAINIRRGHDDPEDQLQGLLEDWHARLTLMKVSWYLVKLLRFAFLGDMDKIVQSEFDCR